VASKHRLPIFDRFLNIEKSVSPEELRANISLQFALLDTDHSGFLTLDELKGGRLLPGIDDLEVNDKIGELLHRLADDNGDGRVSQSEYTRLVLKFHEVGYRKSFVADAVLAVFDENGDGLIDAREMKSILRVFGCDNSDEAVREAMKACDTNGDGKVSSEELATVLKAIKVDK
jgi:Ca2+-binding EF-hand superfamily protein